MKILPILKIEQFPENYQQDFYANDFSTHVRDHHHQINTPHKHDFYLTMLFTRGKGIHEVDFHTYPIKAGSVFMLKPGQTHNWSFSPDTEGYIFFHTKAFYDLVYTSKTIDRFPFFYTYQNSPYLQLDAARLAAIEPWFQNLLKEYRSEQLFKSEKIICLVDMLYIELSRLYMQDDLPTLSDTPGMYFEKIKQLDHLIDQKFLTHKSASAYAEMMHMSTRHLNRITQSVLGKTTTDLIAERVLLEAQRMLAHSKVTVAEVADQLGYDDPSYFSRLFKKKLHLSPTAFSNKYH